jgi:hypothetical protein
VDIGSNDGTFLKAFQSNNRILGIDPAENIVADANKNNIFTIAKFFNFKTAKFIKSYFGKAKVISCNNVFAHNDNLSDIVLGVKELLHDDGLFVFENTYLIDMYSKCIFDIIYHEHIHQHSIKPLCKFFNKFGMDIYNVERLFNHGGSIRVYVCNSGMRKIENIVNELCKLEENDKLDYFKSKFETLKSTIYNRLTELKNQGKKIAIYGVPAKATTLMYAFKLDKSLIDFAVDDAILKQGLFTPGKQIPIYSPDMLYTENPDYVLILGWNFADSIIKNHSNFKGKWIIPMPEYIEK